MVQPCASLERQLEGFSYAYFLEELPYACYLEDLQACSGISHLLLPAFPHRSHSKKNSKINSATTGPNNGMDNPLESVLPDGMEVNNFGPNLGLQVVEDRQRNVSKDELK